MGCGPGESMRWDEEVTGELDLGNYTIELRVVKEGLSEYRLAEVSFYNGEITYVYDRLEQMFGETVEQLREYVLSAFEKPVIVVHYAEEGKSEDVEGV